MLSGYARDEGRAAKSGRRSEQRVCCQDVQGMRGGQLKLVGGVNRERALSECVRDEGGGGGGGGAAKNSRSCEQRERCQGV